MRNWVLTVGGLGCALLVSGCPKGNSDFSQGKKAETLQDYDTALIHYEKALKSDPRNIEYKIKATRLRFEAGQYHVRQGQKDREKGDLQLAMAEFQKALAIDPSSAIAEQEVRQTLELIASKRAADEAGAAAPKPPAEEALAARPPELKPLSRAPYNLLMTNDAKMIFETIGKLAGITVIFDPDFPARRISTELTNVTLEQALDIVSLQSKAFWKPVTSNIIFVAPDQVQKRRDYEEQVVRTFYLHNAIQAQDLTEIVTGLRQLLDLRHLQQLNSQNAIIIRDTPDKLAIAEKIIQDVDKAKPEVIVQVLVLRARVDRVRDLGIQPGGSSTLAFTPASTTTGSSGSSSTTTPTATSVALNKLKSIGTKDYSVTLPGATASALLTDSTTKIIQNPELRMLDGQPAKLKIGDRIPVATGSFQAGVGIGGATAGGIVNPLVNTQFQYQDTGVNVDITPRIHPNHEVSLKISIEISSVSGNSSIGGISQPIISQNKIEHDVRLHDGEVNILGGLIDRTETKNLSGWPGLQKIPFFRYFFSSEHTESQEEEILIVLIPHIVRMPEWTAENLRSISAGTDTNIQVRRESSIQAPPATGAPPAAPVQPPSAANPPKPSGAGSTPSAPEAKGTRLRFEPQNLKLKVGETATIGIVVEDAKDLFSIPMLLQYDPKVISVEEVRHGGFLSGGTQEIAIVQRVDKERGQAIISATRQPDTPGVNGSGTLVGIVVRGVAPGTSTLAIVQVNAHDSQQNIISLATGEANIQVQP
jgi:general secretion pathway protein D